MKKIILALAATTALAAAMPAAAQTAGGNLNIRIGELHTQLHREQPDAPEAVRLRAVAATGTSFWTGFRVEVGR